MINESNLQVNISGDYDIFDRSSSIRSVIVKVLSKGYLKVIDEALYIILDNYQEIFLALKNQFTYEMVMRKLLISKLQKSENFLLRTLTIVKIIMFQLHFEKIIELDYNMIRLITKSSDILPKYYFNVWGFIADKNKYKGIDFRVVYPLLLKNRIRNVIDINNDMIKEFYDYSLTIEGDRRATVYSAQYVWVLHKELFKRNIISLQPIMPNSVKISDLQYFQEIENEMLKQKIMVYLEKGKFNSRTKIKHRNPLKYFCVFMDEYFPNFNISDFDLALGNHFKYYLEEQLEQNAIPSRNWAYMCITKVNSFLNFLYDCDECKPVGRNLLNPNIFEEGLKRSKRDIPSPIVKQILERAKEIGELEWAFIKIYEGTGMRINELSLLSIDSFGKNAKEIIGSDLPGIREDICYIKVVSPKILDIERIVLADAEVYKALEIIKADRDRNFIDIQEMKHPWYPRLGKRKFLILNSFGLPYSSIDTKISRILEKMRIVDENENLINITTHQFRHTYATKMRENDVPIHVTMDMMGHLSPAMNDMYGKRNIDVNDIIYASNIQNTSSVTINYGGNKITIDGTIIDEFSELYKSKLKRGGYCTQDEFQEACVDIDCIECNSNCFKTNITFLGELEKSHFRYLKIWANENIKTSDKAVHYLYISYLYEKLILKIKENPEVIEISIDENERKDIHTRVGM